jgi:hypothetical protein
MITTFWKNVTHSIDVRDKECPHVYHINYAVYIYSIYLCPLVQSVRLTLLHML